MIVLDPDVAPPAAQQGSKDSLNTEDVRLLEEIQRAVDDVNNQVRG
jgi:hypothetical protein